MLTCVMHVMTTYSGHPFFMVQFYNAPANEYQAFSNRNSVYISQAHQSTYPKRPELPIHNPKRIKIQSTSHRLILSKFTFQVKCKLNLQQKSKTSILK